LSRCCRSPSGFAQVRNAAAAAAAAQVLAQFDRKAVLPEALNEICGVEDALMFAAPTDSNERHFRLDKLAECSAEAMFASVAVAGTNAASAMVAARGSTLLAANEGRTYGAAGGVGSVQK
jgi:hypothetical protein